MAKSNGVIVWEGESLLEPGAPVAVILTGLAHDSTNSKTGPMVQAYVLRTDKSPSDAVKDGSDSAICGNCKHRSGSNIGRSCYVIYWQAPLKIYQSLARYPSVMPKRVEMRGRGLRITAYGDAAAVPSHVWLTLAGSAGWWTGYTSQWRTCDPALKTILMASVYNEDEAALARLLGWRTFRTRRHGDLIASSIETICPASEEAGHRTTCSECRLCRGTSLEARSVAILPHGQRVKWLGSR